MKLSDKIGTVSKIGPVQEQKLNKIGIKTVGDFLYHFPSRYEDFSSVTKIAELRPNKKTTIKGKVKVIQSAKTSAKKMPYTEALIEDETTTVKVIWFYQPYLVKTLQKAELFISGTPTYRSDGLQFINPTYEKINKEVIHTAGIIPIYPETEGLSSKWIRYILKNILREVSIKETLPPQIIKEFNLLSVNEALKKIHFPKSENDFKMAEERFGFERVFYIQLASLKKRLEIKKEKSNKIEVDIDYIKEFVENLPFKLTDSQRKASWQILKDLEKGYPMNRLLEGDVGSGKTVIATIATLATIKAGLQVAIMAPTEVLATQHFKKISDMLKEFNLNVGFLTGKKDTYKSKKLKNEFIEISRKKLLEKVKSGEIDLLIGTHALIQEKVVFDNLGLVIVDEQHRFGIEQRAKLCKKKKIPHLLSMTATPIPRTLALTIYGDLDISILDELPTGRKKIITKIPTERNRQKIYSFIKEELKKGRQAFFICPKIEESQKENSVWNNVKSIEKLQEELKKDFSEYEVKQIHGKMTSTEKAKIMEDFKNNKIDILASTSVIEVGIDIPNATVMVIEGAEMFGLAQLHQFRGRVGRSDMQSYCFLFPSSSSQKSKERLQALIKSENSFELSEKDLELRGPGDLSGKKQWGVAGFTMKALKNIQLVQKSREAAHQILAEDYSLKSFPIINKKLASIERNIHLE